MLKKKSRWILLGLIAVLAFIGTSALECVFTVDYSYAPYVYVMAPDGVTGLSGYDVALWTSGAATAAATAATDANGKATFSSDLAEGTYTIVVTAPSDSIYSFPNYQGTVGEYDSDLGTIIAILYDMYDISGAVLNAKVKTTGGDPEPIASVEVALWLDGASAAEATATTATDGQYAFVNVSPGLYQVKASKTGYAFIDETIEISSADVVQNIIGFQAEDAYTIQLIALWDDSSLIDVDSHITYTYDGKSGAVDMDNPYAAGTSGQGYSAADVAATVLPPSNSGTPDREHVYYPSGDRASTRTMSDIGFTGDTRKVVELDVDYTDGPGPETISIRDFPFDWTGTVTTFGTDGDAYNALSTTRDYAWLGSFQYYVHSYSSTEMLATEDGTGSAGLTIYVTQGTEIKGRYVLPDYTDIDTTSILRINMLLEDTNNDGVVATDGTTDHTVFQIVPMEYLLWGITSTNESTAFKGGRGDGILTLAGRPRG